MGRGRTTTGAIRLLIPRYPRLPGYPSMRLPGGAVRLLAESGAPDKRGTKFRR